jgi:Erv1 / Alr family
MPSHLREVWGPRVWRLLHRLSFYSDRRDAIGAWKTLLKSLNECMPCALCRTHMKHYLATHPITIPLGSGGTAVKTYMIDWLYHFHNHVRISGGGIEFPREELGPLYNGDGRAACVAEANLLLGEIRILWSDIPTRDFRTAAAYLIGLINGGPLL